jgi:LPS-assembly lipoprotein
MSWSRTCLVFVACVLGACGFQVRGRADFPPAMTVAYVDTANRYSPFYRELTMAIRASGRQLTEDATIADTVITVLGDETGQRVLSVSARNVPREYDVYYTIRYAVAINGTTVVEPQTLTLNRDYTYDETEVLGKAVEEDGLRDALAADLVTLLMRRMSTLN